MSKWKQIESCDVMNHLLQHKNIKAVLLKATFFIASGIYDLDDSRLNLINRLIKNNNVMFFKEEKEEEK